MTQIEVNASRSYTIHIGSGILADLGKHCSKSQTVCLVSDETIWQLYGAMAEESCRNCGLEVYSFVFSAGESSKDIRNYVELINFLAENKLTRKDAIIALGGGVVGDLAGFAAATYLRGIPYIQVPTSLLAMVDSSVGGKTGIDLPAGKNLCGAFYQPQAVLCDTDVLSTLPEEIFRDGCAEVIKYAVLFDPELFEILERDGLAFDREWVIARCIQHKRKCVEQDEFDRGQRMLLNLGHTIGHAIETCSNYEISHGKAVSIGIAVICRATKCPDTQRIITLLEKFRLPATTDLSAEKLGEAALSDKKRSGDWVNLIVPKAIGNCQIVPTHMDTFKTLLKEGL